MENVLQKRNSSEEKNQGKMIMKIISPHKINYSFYNISQFVLCQIVDDNKGHDDYSHCSMNICWMLYLFILVSSSQHLCEVGIVFPFCKW